MDGHLNKWMDFTDEDIFIILFQTPVVVAAKDDVSHIDLLSANQHLLTSNVRSSQTCLYLTLSLSLLANVFYYSSTTNSQLSS